MLVLFGNSAPALSQNEWQGKCVIGTPRQGYYYQNSSPDGNKEVSIWIIRTSFDPSKIDAGKTMENLLKNGKLTANNTATIVALPGSRNKRTDFGEADGYVISTPNSAGVNTTLVLFAEPANNGYAEWGYNPHTKQVFNKGGMSSCFDYRNNTNTTYGLYNKIVDLNDDRIQAIAIVKKVERFIPKQMYGSF